MEWGSYLEGRNDLSQLRRDANSRRWAEIADRTGLSWEDARDLGCHIRGKPLRSRGQRPRSDGKTPKPTNAKDGVHLSVKGDTAEAVAKGESIRTLPQLIAAAEIDLTRWIVDSWKANTWEMGSGDGEKIRLWQVKANLKRRPPWVVDPVRPIRHLKRKRSRAGGSRDAALVIPDSQNGYRWDTRHRNLDPLHDRRCWDLAVQVAQRVQPSIILLLGDMLDLAPWSTKYADGADLRGTTQPTLAELHWWLAQLRLASPGARILYLEGNHEDRIAKALRQLLAEAEGVRPAGEEDGPAMLSVERLLNLESIDVEYVGPYDAEHWLWDTVRVHHGEKVRAKGGATASAVVSAASHSEIFGHVHRLELACRTLHGPEGERTLWAMSPGTIARIDGAVPSAVSRVDWQQGLAVIERDASGRLYPQLLTIEDGRTCWCREVLEGADRAEEISEATGWAFA